MEYRKYGDTYYIRGDRGDEIVACILAVCEKENIASATFAAIGGCGAAEIQTFIPEEQTYETRRIEGMLELASMNGSVTRGVDGGLAHHTHAVFAYKEDGEHKTAGGHIKSATVLITAEIELRPVAGGTIGRRRDDTLGAAVWDFVD